MMIFKTLRAMLIPYNATTMECRRTRQSDFYCRLRDKWMHSANLDTRAATTFPIMTMDAVPTREMTRFMSTATTVYANLWTVNI